MNELVSRRSLAPYLSFASTLPRYAQSVSRINKQLTREHKASDSSIRFVIDTGITKDAN